MASQYVQLFQGRIRTRESNDVSKRSVFAPWFEVPSDNLPKTKNQPQERLVIYIINYYCPLKLFDSKKN